MVQVPTVTMVTVVPLTVQTPVVWLVKVTPRPEVAVAATAKDASLKVKGPTAGKLMLWSAWLIVMFWRSEEPRLNSSHSQISYAVFCLKKKKKKKTKKLTREM